MLGFDLDRRWVAACRAAVWSGRLGWLPTAVDENRADAVADSPQHVSVAAHRVAKEGDGKPKGRR